MPTQAFGIYPANETAGTQVSSTYEGRHVTMTAAELVSATAVGTAVKGLPVVFGTVGLQGVGIAFNSGTLTDLIAVDTEGIWNVSCVAVDDAGNSLIVGGDPLFINTATCVVSKRRNIITQIPFGYALGQVVAGGTAVIAVKVHWDHPDADGVDALMLPGGSKQDILTESETQNYEIGARLELPARDGRIFRYMHADPVVGCRGQFGCFARSDQAYWGDLAQPAIPQGSTIVTVTLVAGSNVAENELAGGWFGGFGDRGFYHILSNEAHVGGTSVVITLDRPTWRAMGGGAQGIYLHPNIYGRVMNPDVARLNLQGWATVVGIPLIPITADNYFWGQTWGPMNLINGTWGNLAGTYVNKREVCFDWDGAVQHRSPEGAPDAYMQHAGHVLWDGRNNPNVEGDAMIMIEIHP